MHILSMESINESDWTFPAVQRFGTVCYTGAGILWNSFHLSSPSWIETTHELQGGKKRAENFIGPQRKLNLALVLLMTGPCPSHLTLSFAPYISLILSLISCYLIFYTSSTLPPQSFYLGFFLIYSNPPCPTPSKSVPLIHPNTAGWGCLCVLQVIQISGP